MSLHQEESSFYPIKVEYIFFIYPGDFLSIKYMLSLIGGQHFQNDTLNGSYLDLKYS